MKIEESVQAEIKDFLKSDEVAEKIITFRRDFLCTTTDKKFENEIIISGFCVTLPVLNAFVSPESDLSIIKNDHRKFLMYMSCRMYFDNNIDGIQRGVNAFDIGFNLSTQKLIWGKSFEEFLASREIKIIKWNTPLQDILNIFLLRDQFDCYFDIKHHLKALENFLDLDNEVLTQQSIDISLNSSAERELLKSYLSPYKIFYFKDINIKSKKKGYPYVKNFIKTLSPESSKMISKTIDLFSPTTKRSHLEDWKKSTLSTKTLGLFFGKTNFSKEILKTFHFFFLNFTFKEDLEMEMSVTEKEFEEAMMTYKRLNKDLSIQEMKSLLRPGIIKELSNYNNESFLEAGPILSSVLGIIPSHKIMVNQPKYFNGYQVDQVKTILQLKRIGRELSNCLTHAEEYWEDLIAEEDNSYFFYFQAPKGTNLKSFLCLISLEDNTFNVIEAFRKSNEPLSINDQFNLTSFLSSEGIALLPKDVFIVSFGIDFLYQLSSISPDKIIEFISTNKDFMGFILKESLGQRRDLGAQVISYRQSYRQSNEAISGNSIKVIKDHLVKLFPESKYKINNKIIDRALKNYSSNFFLGNQDQLLSSNTQHELTDDDIAF